MADFRGSIPFVTDVELRGLGNTGATLITYRDQTGRTIARSIADADRLEELGRALMAMAFAVRQNTTRVIIDVNLMRRLTITPGGEASTIHAHPPLDRLDPSNQGVQP